MNNTNKKSAFLRKRILFGSPNWARTSDIMINSHALYRLSYRGILSRNCSVHGLQPCRFVVLLTTSLIITQTFWIVNSFFIKNQYFFEIFFCFRFFDILVQKCCNKIIVCSASWLLVSKKTALFYFNMK